MFDHTYLSESRSRPAVVAKLQSICADIAALGLRLPSLRNGGTSINGGPSLPVSVNAILTNQTEADDFLENLARFTATNTPVCLHPEDFPSHCSSIDAWRIFCEAVADYLMQKKLPLRQISTCIHSHRMPLPAYSLIADSVLGRGSRFVLCDGLQMTTHRDKRIEARTNTNWVFLWRQRNSDRPVTPVYGGFVRSACKLLSDEAATTIEPAASSLIPKGSAWISVDLPLTRFCTNSGQIDVQRLGDTVRKMVVLADQLIDEVDWHDDQQQTDAVANRRLAIHISGLGDLLQIRTQHPGALESLEWLKALVCFVRKKLIAISTELATERGALPALSDANPVAQWADGAHRENWLRHWQLAVNQTALRNRNLLVLSPAAILPSNGINSAAFTDLLPLLALADAWSFSSAVPTPGWTLAQFRGFHRRARATIQASQRSSFVADTI